MLDLILKQIEKKNQIIMQITKLKRLNTFNNAKVKQIMHTIIERKFA